MVDGYHGNHRGFVKIFKIRFCYCLCIVLRTRLLPLHIYNDEISKEGLIVEIGSGYGIMAKFLALSSSKRYVIGFNPDIEKR
jgi:hypothetical protein